MVASAPLSAAVTIQRDPFSVPAILEMPGGQSGNPASPYFIAGHEAWVRGDATPFLPGPAVHTLTLATG